MEITWPETHKVLEEYAETLIAKYWMNFVEDDYVVTGDLYNNLSYKINVND